MKTKQLLVSALIQCNFDHGFSSWYSGLSRRAKSGLQVAQNKTIRFILGIPSRAHIGKEEFKCVLDVSCSHENRTIKVESYVRNF